MVNRSAESLPQRPTQREETKPITQALLLLTQTAHTDENHNLDGFLIIFNAENF